MPTRKSVGHQIFGSLFAIFAVCAVFSAAVVFAADDYPSKPVRIIIPLAPGGGTSIMGRMIATKLSERLGKQVVVENIGGAGGVIATEMVAKARPDGYTLLFTPANHSTLAALQKLPYDPIKSFTPVARCVTGHFSLVVNASVPAKSVKELIALAKQKPGQLIFASSGIGTLPHLGTELFKMMADIDFKIVQFKGGGPAVIDMIGGHSHAMIMGLSTTLPHIKSGKAMALGICGVNRSAILPDVPTVAESGVPGYNITQWFGILAPAGTPAPVVDRLNNELRLILATDEVKNQSISDGGVADYLGPAGFGPFLDEDIARYTNIVKKANIKVEE